MNFVFVPEPADAASGGRTNVVQHYRTTSPDVAPPANMLLEGEIGIELADPMKLWVGVPAAMDPTERKLLLDTGALLAGDYLPLAGGTLTGPLISTDGAADRYSRRNILLSSTGDYNPGLYFEGGTQGRQDVFLLQRYGTGFYVTYADALGGTQTDLLSFSPAGIFSCVGMSFSSGVNVVAIKAPTSGSHLTNKTYVDGRDTALQDQIDLLASGMLFVGGMDVPIDAGTYSIESGLTNGPLPAPGAGLKGWYVIVTNGGSPPAGNIPPGSYAQHDWIVCDGAQWMQLKMGLVNFVASDIAIAPAIGTLGPTVQTGLQWLYDNKIDAFGDTMTGPLYLAADPVAALEAATKQYVDRFNPAGAYLPLSGGTLSGGLGFGSAVAATPDTVSRHIALYGTSFGFSITGSRLNYVLTQPSNQHFFRVGGADKVAINSAGITMQAGTAITLAADPTAPMQATPKQWVEEQIAATGLYQGTWDPTLNVPDLMTSAPRDGYSWIVSPAPQAGVVITWDIPGLLGMEVYSGDHLIWDANLAIWERVRAGDLSYVEGIDLFLQLAGGTLTGPLYLAADPMQPLEAATKQYADTKLTQATADGRYLQLAGGTMTGGLSFGSTSVASPGYLSRHISLWGTGTGFSVTSGRMNVVAGSAVYFYIASADRAFFDVTGLTMKSGAAITLAADPTAALHAATKQYVDAHRDPAGAYLPLTGGTLSGGLNINAPGVGSWATSNFGRQLIITGSGTNPAIGIADNTGANYVALINSGGRLILSRMPLPSDSTTPHTPLLTLDSAGNTFNTGGIGFGNQVGASPTDLSKHISLYGGNQYGFSITGGTLNVVATGTIALYPSGAARVAFVSASGIGLDPGKTLALAQDPTAALHAATKQYVDARNPAGAYLPITGGALTGTLSVAGNGICYSGIAAGTDFIGFGWDGTWLRAYVGGALWATALASYDWVNANFKLASAYTPNQNVDYGAAPTFYDVTAQSRVFCNDMMNVSGTFYVANNYAYYLQRGNDGYWRFVENGQENFQVRGNGDAWTRGCLYGARLEASGDVRANGQLSGSNLYTTGTDANNFWAFYNANTGIMCRMDANGAYDVYMGNWSDERLKQDIAPSKTDCLAMISKLSLFEFRYREMTPDGPKPATSASPLFPVGFVAQRVREVFPEAVTGGRVEDDGELSGMGINQNVMMATLVGAVQQLTEANAALAARVAALESRTRTLH